MLGTAVVVRPYIIRCTCVLVVAYVLLAYTTSTMGDFATRAHSRFQATHTRTLRMARYTRSKDANALLAPPYSSTLAGGALSKE